MLNVMSSLDLKQLTYVAVDYTVMYTDVVLETKVLVSRRLKDRNVLVLVLRERSCLAVLVLQNLGYVILLVHPLNMYCINC